MSSGLGIVKRATLDLYASYKSKEIAKHELSQLFWECTLRCNCHCLHCGSDCKVSSALPDMPVKDFIDVIDGIIPHIGTKLPFVIFTGGEALVRKDLEQAGKALYDRKIAWGVVSNGILMTQQRFDSLRRSGMHTATISLDGFKDEHVWLRGNPSAFDGAVNALKVFAKDEAFIYDVVTCVNLKNISYLNDFKEFLISLGVKSWRIFTIFPEGRAAEHPEFQLSNDNFTKVLEFIKKTREEGRIKCSYGCEGFLGKYEMEVRDYPFDCHAGVNVASILIDGSISACPSIRANYAQGNIHKDEFWNVWTNRFQPFRVRSWAKKGTCADCKMWKYCQGNGMHLHDSDGKLLVCHYQRIK